jgi:hypothetical protein
VLTVTGALPALTSILALGLALGLAPVRVNVIAEST